MFWSESAKSLKLLDSIRPILLPEDQSRQEEIITDIRKFFLEKGAGYLDKALDKTIG